MASAIQIVPKGQFPHVETFIYDNTEVTDTPAVDVDDSIKTIHVFRSPKGINNKIIKQTNQSNFADNFGKTDYKKFGQALMMPYASLSSGLTSVSCMRIMPNDATYANSALYAYYRTATVTVSNIVTDENGDTVFGDDGYTPKTEDVEKTVFQVMFRSKNFYPDVDSTTNRLNDGTTGIHTAKELDSLTKENIEDISAVEEEGNTWKCVPIATFMSVGSGIYGNDYKWRVTKNSEYEADYEKEIYTFEIMSVENGVEKIATYVGSIVTTIVNDSSIFINDVITDYDLGEYPVDICFYEESVEILYDEYVKFLNTIALEGIELEVPSINEFDLFFGSTVKTKVPYEYYQVVNAGDASYPIVDDYENNVMPSSDLGVYLRGGYDGSFSMFIDPENKTVINGALEIISSADYQDAMRKGLTHIRRGESTVEDYVYALAFSGLLDKSILSSRRVPADYLLDANYSYTTKISLAQFAIARDDALLYIDLGTEYSTFSSAVLKKLEKDFNGIFRNRIISLNAHSGNVVDPFSKRKVAVTQTHRIAENLPIHWNTNGMETPYAKAYAPITGFAKRSLVPVIDLHETDLMDQLTNMRINYIEATGEEKFQRAIQNTAQNINSDLTEESNMHILLWLKRNIENDIFDSLYNFANKSDRATFRQIEKARYENIIGRLVNTFDIRFEMNQYETERQIIHCYVDVEFRTLMKRGIIEIDVNKRKFNS